MHMKLEQEIDC